MADRVFNPNREQPTGKNTISRDVRNTVVEVSKRTSSISQESRKVYNNINKTLNDLIRGKITLEDANSIVQEMVEELGEIEASNTRISKSHRTYLDDLLKQQQIVQQINGTLNEQVTTSEDRLYSEETLNRVINKRRESNEQETLELATHTKLEQQLTEILEASNEVYQDRVNYVRAQLDHLEEQRELQLNILTDEKKSAEEKLAANEKLLDTEEKIYELKLASDKLDKEKQEALERAQRIAQRTNTARDLASGTGQFESNTIFTKLGKLLEETKLGFQANRDEGNSPIKSLLNIDAHIREGNEDAKSASKMLTNVLTSGFNALNTMIDHATSVMASSYGKVNAAIDGSGKTFSDYADGLSKLGTSALVRQEDLLTNLADIATKGIATDLESIALLTTIRDKTVASFDTTDGNLRRLIRLNQNLGNLTAKQFGLAAVLRTELNEAFGDSSFIGRQFQTLTGTLLDAVSSNALRGSTDSTNLYAVMETFAAGLYEAGVDEGTVSAIAQGINYLGSGNVQALSGNKALQNLMLLSMDRAGLDYATILQQGLSTNDTYLLLSEIIDYLADITDNTKQNNVLRSSYANLFNLSVTDMAAIKSLSTNNAFRNMSQTSISLTGDTLMNATNLEIAKIAEERTMLSEMINNVTENLKFELGIGVANSPLAYGAYRTARLGIQAGQALTDIGLTGPGKIATLASGAIYAASLIPGVMNVVENLGTNIKNISEGTNTLSNYYLATLSTAGEGIYSGGTARSSSVQSASSTNFKSFDNTSYNNIQNKASSSSVNYTDKNVWEAEQASSIEDPNTEILKTFEKTIMKAKEGDGYAIAVSLQGMSDGVLKSFASMLVDEDSLEKTMTGKNNVLDKNGSFFKYTDDTSTNQSGNKLTNASQTK